MLCLLRRFSRHRRGVAQPGRALRSGRRGRRFKSCHPDQFIPARSSAYTNLAFRCLPALGTRKCNASASALRSEAIRGKRPIACPRAIEALIPMRESVNEHTMCDVARLDPEFVEPVAGERLEEVAATIKVARELVDKL